MENDHHRDLLKTEKEGSNRAFLVSAYLGRDVETCNEHLEELELLCETYGFDVIGQVGCHLRRYEAATFVTKGKLEELLHAAKELEAEIVVFDDEISPAQQRNLEKLFKIPVIDRTEVILGVFAHRAHSKEAHLQVSLAQLKYQAPRLKRMWTHLSRQASGSGGAFLKGEGEKQIEIDRRLIDQRIHRVEKQIEEVRSQRKIQRLRRKRNEVPTFALIGYTNAGKSTLLNLLTDAGTFVEDKLFATLDTTTRQYTLPNQQHVLIIDTVGFIRKLPHLLVAAFRSTLEEAISADILIHVVNIAHPMAEEQIEASFEVLKELKAEKKPMILVLNQIDRCDNPTIISKIRLKYPRTVLLSAKTGEGLELLQEAMIEEFKKQREVLELCIPQKEYHVVSHLMRDALILHQEYEGNDVLITVEVPASLVHELIKYQR